MNILMVCSEFAPLAKTGGLADAVTGLTDALVARGHDVRVLLPRYAHLPPADAATNKVARPKGKHRFLELRPGRAAPTAHAADPSPLRPRERTDGGARDGGAEAPPAARIYLLDLGEPTPDGIYLADERDAARFGSLCAAAVELGDVLGWRPDVLHCHDWHAALVPLVLRSRPRRPAIPTVLTLHNIGYQGVFPDTVLEANGLGALRDLIAPDALAGGEVNFLRAGLRAADAVTTVSPTYALEIRTPAFGMGLEDVLNERGDAVVGILNGVDYAVWSPSTDPFIGAHYDADNVTAKAALKSALTTRLKLATEPADPLVGIVSRLAPQKGLDLVAAALPTLLAETRVSFVCLGTGEAPIAADLSALAVAYPSRVAFVDGYDEALAHLIFAGCDIALVPSRYEPCGLTQMYALRYGTIPVVRATGGLADTIKHFDPATGAGNGSVFRDADPPGLLWGIRSALAWYDDPAAWARVVANAMAADFSWRQQAPHYEAVYRNVTR